ncbi:MAG: hypothetical protein OEL79_07340 [Chromatiales bacterium]|nr:hypothetical protein [Chromatiales bacterium]
MRILNITFRSLHLVGLLGSGGGILFDVIPERVMPWLWLTILSGLALTLLSIWSGKIFLIQLRGMVILLKMAMLLLILYTDGADLILLIGATLLSGFIAHAPGDIRYYSIFHGRRVDSL